MTHRPLIAAGLILTISLSACGSSNSSSGSSATSTPAAGQGAGASGGGGGIRSVGLVTDVGGLDDKSFNHDAFLGVQEAEKAYGARGSVVVSKAQADYVPNLTAFAKQGKGLTVAVGFLMQSAIYQVAKAHPGSKFAIVDGAPTDAKGHTSNLSNVANLFFKEQESGYLVGLLAGLMEKNHIGKATHNTVGCMGGLSIPPVNRYIAGFVAGARKADPGIKILRGYSQSFSDQNAGKSIGLSQISQGADILFQVAGASGLGYLAAAQQRGVYGIGADADQGYLGSYVIASAIKRVDIAVKDTVHDEMTGHFRGGDHLFSLKNNGTGFVVSGTTVPASIVSQVKAYQAKIASGAIVPPQVVSGT